MCSTCDCKIGFHFIDFFHFIMKMLTKYRMFNRDYKICYKIIILTTRNDTNIGLSFILLYNECNEQINEILKLDYETNFVSRWWRVMRRRERERQRMERDMEGGGEIYIVRWEREGGRGSREHSSIESERTFLLFYDHNL